MDYGNLPPMVQFALADVEAQTHLERAGQAARMWRTVADELRELSDALGRELDHLRPQWIDATGADFARRAAVRKAAIDETLQRITANEPWRALEDLAGQLLLTRGNVAATVERPTDVSHTEAAVHLGELDRYFLAAAEAVLAAAGGDSPATDGVAGDCCAEPGATPFVLTGDPDPALGTGTSLPPGSVSMPGLVAVPPGAGGYVPRGSRAPGGRSFDPRSVAGGSPGSGASGPRAAGGSAAGLAGGAPDFPARIERAANPIPLTDSPDVPQAPQPPSLAGGAKPGSTGLAGGMIPPMMMMPPMVPGTSRSTMGRRSGGLPGAGERRTRTSQATPGVPARLRGRSAVADPAASGFRPVAMSGKANGPAEPAALDHEVWQVENPGAVSPLKPEVPEPEPPRRLRRPRA